tara:strand:+ start:142 stop:342 length:201 start_codon:yes stop_codon:yes gene_type:complete
MFNKITEIIQTLINPLSIEPHKYNDDMKNYYKYYKPEKCYLHISVKYLNGKGFVVTAFLTKKIIRR